MSRIICKNFLKMNFSALLLILVITEVANADTTVQTTNGPVRGTTVADGKVEAFLGIPYAEPPVGRLRFAKPVPKAPWEDVYEANQLPPACMQSKFAETFFPELGRQNEDCLYLNLWVPQSSERSELKPIILFIHGGGFMIGSSNQKICDGAALAEHGDVIVASINYRLGGLGFFTAFTEDAPGNMGMHDQVAAIRWVKENAKNFQGDPDDIVLMGLSAGAFSVSAHLISPLSKNLFRRAILLSGTLLHPTFSDNNKKLSKLSQEYANAIGCAGEGETLDNNSQSIVECMKNVPSDKFAEDDTKALRNTESSPRDIYTLMLHPRIGDDFLPENTIDSFRKGNFKNTEILFGISRDEGSQLLVGFTPALFGAFGEKTPFLNETSTRQFIENFMNSDDESEDERIIQAYMDRVNEEEEYAYLKALNDAYGDYAITCGAVFQADIQSLKNNPIYFYMFDYLSPSAVYAKWMGVPHGEDIYYVFGNFINPGYSEIEKEISVDLMDRLVNFAKTGNPNIPNGVKWPRYTFEDPKYLAVGKRDKIETKPDHNRCEVWRRRFGSIIDDDLIRRMKNN